MGRAVKRLDRSGGSAKPKQVRYETCLVTYIDILGFRRLLQERRAGEISRILRIFKTVVNRDRGTETDFKRLYESFSDLTVRAVTVSSADYLLVRPSMLQYELESIAKIQIELLLHHGILIRGGIAIGSLVKSWGLVYGEGMVSAYELETQAKHPRVLIQDTLIQVADKLEEQNRGFLIKRLIASDGLLRFVDYLEFSTNHFDNHDDLLDFLTTHKTFIEVRLKQFVAKPKIRAKYRWLKRYHNATIRHLGGLFIQEGLLIK